MSDVKTASPGDMTMRKPGSKMQARSVRRPRGLPGAEGFRTTPQWAIVPETESARPETAMTLTMRDAHRHADRILELVRSGFHEQANDVVAQSWSRCLNEYQLHPT
jgi:hypothetical protein